MERKYTEVICDRCGKDVHKDHPPNEKNTCHMAGSIILSGKAWDGAWAGTTIKINLDLCHGCTNELREWLKRYENGNS